MKKSEIKLGNKVKDTISGITGIAFGHITFLNGCDQIGIKQQAVNKEGESYSVEYFDISHHLLYLRRSYRSSVGYS